MSISTLSENNGLLDQSSVADEPTRGHLEVDLLGTDVFSSKDHVKSVVGVSGNIESVKFDVSGLVEFDVSGRVSLNVKSFDARGMVILIS